MWTPLAMIDRPEISDEMATMLRADDWLTLLQGPKWQQRFRDIVYSASPLWLNRGQIRLLQLQPARDHTGDIECSLLRVELDCVPQYEALSYTWGDPRDPGLIVLNRQPFRVTRNLLHALRDLRYEDEVRVLWVDALCINQADVTEREEQVRQMTRIYQQARRVLVWLGSSVSVPIRSAVKFFQDWPISRQFSLAGGREIQSGTDGLQHSPYMTNEQLQGLFEIVQSAWFRRVWVVQEVAVAQDVLIGRGSMRGTDSAWFSWSTLVDTNGHWMRAMLNCFQGDVVQFAQYTSQLGCMYELRQSIVYAPEQPRWPLERLMRAGESFDSTDPVDKVFALLGMAEDRESLNLVPDYVRGHREVFQDATVAICISSNNLDILTLGLKPKLPGLPTWTRDFSACPEPVYTKNAIAMPVLPLADLSYTASRAMSPTIEFDRGLGRLTVAGKPLSRISERFPVELELLTYLAGEAVSTEEIVEPKHSHLCIDDEERSDYSPIHFHIEAKNFGELHRLLSQAKAYGGVGGVASSTDDTMRLVWVILMGQRHMLGEDVSISDIDDSYGHGTWKDCRNPNSLVFALTHGSRIAHIKSYMQSQAPMISPVLRASAGRSFYVTESGHAGLCPADARPGDIIVVAFGACVPLVLRAGRGDETHSLVGGCFTYGLMDGEMLDLPVPVEHYSLS